MPWCLIQVAKVEECMTQISSTSSAPWHVSTPLVYQQFTHVTITLARDGVVVYTDAGLNREKDKESIGMAAIDSCGHFFNAFGTPYSICREGHNC